MKKLFLHTLHISLLICTGLYADMPTREVEYKSTDSRAVNGCSTDYVIVGLGTASGPLARFLSDPVNGRYPNGVLVLEAGQNLTTDPLVTSGDFAVALDTWFDPKYSTFLTPTYGELNTGLIPQPYTDGRMWGGSGAHNGMIAVRGAPSTWDELAAASGNSQWSYNNLLPVFRGFETFVPNGSGPVSPERGTSGPIFITQDPFTPVANNDFINAVSAGFGVPVIPDYNVSSGTVGISSNQWFYQIVNGQPFRSFLPAYLPQSILNADGTAVGARKLRVLSPATVTRVIFSGKKAIGVEYILDGNKEQVFRVFARKKVILSAGTPRTTALLQRSGIGDANLLNSLGIPVVVDNPNVGQNLQNHFGPTGLISGSTVVTGPDPFFQIVETFLSVNNGGNRNIQIFWLPGTLLFGNGDTALLRCLGVDPESVAVTGFPFQIVNPKSRGNIEIVSTDPLTPPRMNFNFYGNGQDDLTDPTSDASVAVQCYKLLKNIETQSSGAFQVIYPPAADYADDALLFADGLDVFLVQDHACGTCAMGTSIASGGVVDGFLNVFGVQNLMIADNSIATVINTGNNGYTAYIIGLKAAQFLGATIPLVP